MDNIDKILLDKRLSPMARIILIKLNFMRAPITHSNKELGKIFDITERQVYNIIRELREKKYIKCYYVNRQERLIVVNE